MYEAIKNFAKQFAFEPVVENADKLPLVHGFIVAGMGGSHLAADLLRVWKPELDLTVLERSMRLRKNPREVAMEIAREWVERKMK